SELSAETGLQAEAVSSQVYSLGAASNVVANLAALQPAGLRVVGAIGHDIFGRELTRMLEETGADTTGLVIQDGDFETVVYGKRVLDGVEQPRIDFGMRNRRNADTDRALLDGIESAMEWADALVLNQQTPGSIPDPGFIKNLNGIVAAHPETPVVLDTRHYGERFRGTSRKLNELEAAHLNGVEVALGDTVGLEDLRGHAEALYKRDGRPAFVTRGPRGMLVAGEEGIHVIPGIQLLKKRDTVGAGDTALSGIVCCLAAGGTPLEAGEFANFAATVTVQKILQTGTASGPEILEVAADHDYEYEPELAEDPGRARMVEGAEIEICPEFESVRGGKIAHAVVDHDGTVSTLRQGWEDAMEPVMIRAILGAQHDTADEALCNKIRERVRGFIDKSTGIQTILQMEGLIDMVREFEIVPGEQILDKFGYKEIYNTALMKTVDVRVEKFQRGELGVDDYTIRGSVLFFQELRARSVTLYLASGTDREDVVSEAGVLGYAELFNGGIYGAVGDVSKYSKKLVIDRILTENNLRGKDLVTFGDGPVEMRECRKRGGVSVGIATDEVRRFGWNPEKRERLIKAGAHLLVPDFSQPQRLLGLLFDEG
ncbi:MAG: carbohydrate kinase, partial [Lentisphaerae bacterium]|nr:carbohydrate kinase [Lentisphaerota bacterium]